MGFLEVGKPIPWEQLSDELKQKVKDDGIRQLLHLWRLNRFRCDKDLKWGDELEFMVLYLDPGEPSPPQCVDAVLPSSAERSRVDPAASSAAKRAARPRNAKLILKAPEVLDALRRREREDDWPPSLACCKQLILHRSQRSFLRACEWHPEFGNHMIEATPLPAFDMSVESLTCVEESMTTRRLKIQTVVQELYGNQAFVVSLPAFPYFGVGLPENYIRKFPGQDLSLMLEGSASVPALLPNPHPRFRTLVHNVNSRRGKRVSYIVRPSATEPHAAVSSLRMPRRAPLDEAPVSPVSPGAAVARGMTLGSVKVAPPAKEHARVCTESAVGAIDRATIGTGGMAEDLEKYQRYSPEMDSFAYGMSQSCLQMTFGTHDLTEARNLYDQMVVLAPLMLAMSAGTPILKGLVQAFDTRWQVLERTCDARTDEERAVAGEFSGQLVDLVRPGRSESMQPPNEGAAVGEISFGRYGLTPMFIGDHEFLDANEESLNDDVDCHYQVNPDAFQLLMSSGLMDARVAKHFAILWSRDPLVVFSDRVDLDNRLSVDHFENIQSTNWNTVRFKPPPPSFDGITQQAIGWRVELRTPDIQLKDSENAAIASMSALLAMAMIREGFNEEWNLYMPMSKVRENMQTAHTRDACRDGRFWWPALETRKLAADEGADEGTSVACAEEQASSGGQGSGEEMSEQSRISNVKCRKLSLHTIFLHPVSGLIPKLTRFVSGEWRSHRCSLQAVEQFRVVEDFCRSRLSGLTPTNAAAIRRLVSRNGSLTHQVKVSTDPDPNSAKTDTTAILLTQELNYDVCKFAVLTGFGLDASNGKVVNLSCPNYVNLSAKARATPNKISVCQRSPIIKQLCDLVANHPGSPVPAELRLGETTVVNPPALGVEEYDGTAVSDDKLVCEFGY